MRDSLLAGALDGYPPEIGSALWRLEEGRERTVRALEGVPAGFIDRPSDGNTIGTILYHLALIEADWLYVDLLGEAIPADVGDLFPVDDRDAAGILSHVEGKSIDEHLAVLGVVRARVLERLRGMTVEEFHRPRALKNYDVTPAWVLHHLSQHEAEHRGELGSIITSFRRDDI